MSKAEINRYMGIIASALAENMEDDETVNTGVIINALINMIIRIQPAANDSYFHLDLF